MRRHFWPAAALATALSSCGGSARDPSTPTPALATTVDAAASFGILRRRWAASSREERVALEAWVVQLRELYQHQPVVHVADVYLAWIALERGDLERARKLARQTETWRAGNVQDLATLLEGAALSREGVPEAALAKLLPLVGKLIDPFARELLHEEAVRAATAAERWSEDIALLDDWLRDAPEEDDRAMILLLAEETLTHMPAGALERALVRMREDDERGDVKHSDALEKKLAMRLATIALARGDKELARRLLAQAGALASLGKIGSDVVDLASSGLEVAEVEGQRVGLLLPAATAQLRSRGDDVALGVLTGLTLLGGGAAKSRLVVRDDAGALSEARRALVSLTTSGAAIVVGGLDPEEARIISEFAETEQIAALLLTTPSRVPPDARWTFLLAPDIDRASGAVAEALARDGARTIAVVGSAGALVTSGAARVLPSVDCAPFAQPRTVSRYPIDDWRGQGVDAVLLAGDARCTEDVLAELRARRWKPRLGLGVEAGAAVLRAPRGSAPGRIAAVSASVAQMGCFPTDAAGLPSAELASWQDAKGVATSWWTVLGRDAAEIAAASMKALPEAVSRNAAEVAERRETVRAALEDSAASTCLGVRARLGRAVTPPWKVVEVRGK